jgi:hypothetical protein
LLHLSARRCWHRLRQLFKRGARAAWRDMQTATSTRFAAYARDIFGAFRIAAASTRRAAIAALAAAPVLPARNAPRIK